MVTNFKDCHVLVIGDVMVDEYMHGHVTRMSPEAPVPVLEVVHRENLLGGAANVAANVRSLGAKATLVGCVGCDEAGITLHGLAVEAGLRVEVFSSIDRRPTTTKTRILGDRRHVVRIDRELTTPIAMPPDVVERISGLLREADVCIVSDYAKGMVTRDLMELVVDHARDKPVIVDPKHRDFALYKGATVITPNLREFELAVQQTCLSKEEVFTAAKGLLRRLQLETGSAPDLLITRGAEGMLLVYQRPATYEHIPTEARAVFDVTGAGDTVVASLAIGMASGLSLLEAARISNIAAGIAVGKLKTSTVSLEELTAAISSKTS